MGMSIIKYAGFFYIAEPGKPLTCGAVPSVKVYDTPAEYRTGPAVFQPPGKRAFSIGGCPETGPSGQGS
jgi:hypothetical protein